MSKQRLILVTNDDGYSAPGIRALVKVAKEFGDIVVVAPDKPQSGMGHAITVSSTIHLKEIDVEGQRGYACSGTPVDCVKLAVNKILNDKPDLVVSGINHGSNASINVIYSGTMSAAIEAGIEGIPAIGFSLCDYSWEANFEHTSKSIKKIVTEALLHGIPKGTVLNVNFPKTDKEPNGIKVCRQARANWKEQFDKRTSPTGKDYYWLSGEFELLDKGQDTDEWALSQGYVSVVPTQFDLTAHHAIPQVNNWSLNE